MGSHALDTAIYRHPVNSESATECTCVMCVLILQTIDQFEFDGCENCEEYLHMKNNRDTVYECTSSSFDGFVLLFLFCVASYDSVK